MASCLLLLLVIALLFTILDLATGSPCNGTQGLDCKCPRGTFLEAESSACRDCDLCPHGYGMVRPCTETLNTSCRRCPTGTYSGVLSATRDCSLCTVCREDQLMLQECNRIQDTVCIDKSSTKRHQLPLDPRSGTTPEGEIVSRYEPEVIPVYCTILLPIGLGLLAYLLLRWRLQKSAKNRHGATLREGEDSAVFRQDALLLGHGPGRLIQQAFSSNKRNDTEKVHFRSLSPDKRLALVASLNIKQADDKDWTGLAKHFGYPSPHVASLELLGQSSGMGPAHHLLAFWGEKADSTVEALAQALMEIGRIDLVWALRPTCQKMFPPFAGGEIV